jgi:hypothetical protein
MSQALRFIHPYLFHVTYKFHVEKAREAGKYAIRSKTVNHFLHASVVTNTKARASFTLF